jgi:hypothetical protein
MYSVLYNVKAKLCYAILRHLIKYFKPLLEPPCFQAPMSSQTSIPELSSKVNLIATTDRENCETCQVSRVHSVPSNHSAECSPTTHPLRWIVQAPLVSFTSRAHAHNPLIIENRSSHDRGRRGDPDLMCSTVAKYV